MWFFCLTVLLLSDCQWIMSIMLIYTKEIRGYLLSLESLIVFNLIKLSVYMCAIFPRENNNYCELLFTDFFPLFFPSRIAINLSDKKEKKVLHYQKNLMS